MKEHFTQEVENLKFSLTKMSALVDDQVERVIKSMQTGDISLCSGIKAKDMEIDAYDNLIQTQCENLFALFQPVAVDLRFVMSALMINNHLERCGNIAVNISKRIKKTSGFKELITEARIAEMGVNAKEMLQNAISSFINNDSELARRIIDADEVVDQLNKDIFRFLVTKMKSDPELIDPCSHLIVLSRNIERLADHATNIAANLIFYVEAQKIAHQKNSIKNNDVDFE